MLKHKVRCKNVAFCESLLNLKKYFKRRVIRAYVCDWAWCDYWNVKNIGEKKKSHNVRFNVFDFNFKSGASERAILKEFGERYCLNNFWVCNFLLFTFCKKIVLMYVFVFVFFHVAGHTRLEQKLQLSRDFLIIVSLFFR